MAKVYLSSTYQDLEEYREAVYSVLRKMGHDAIGMEDYVADDRRPKDKCLTDVEECDIYVGIFAWRYGYIPDGEDKSITELEYRHAKDIGIPCLLFLLADDSPWPPSKMDIKSGDSANGKLINRLREELKKEKIVSFFENEIELAAEVSVAIYKAETKSIIDKNSELWEYFLTIDLLTTGLSEITKDFNDLNRGLIYRPYKTIDAAFIPGWIHQKIDDLLALVHLLKVSIDEELMGAWDKPGTPGDEGKIRDAVGKILDGCKGFLDWEIDLTYTRFPNEFIVIKEMMSGWTEGLIAGIKKIPRTITEIISAPEVEGKQDITIVIKAPENIEDIVTEVEKILKL